MLRLKDFIFASVSKKKKEFLNNKRVEKIAVLEHVNKQL